MQRADMPALLKLSPPEIKPVAEWLALPTLVATEDEVVVGYTQFAFNPSDLTFTSRAIRVDAAHKGKGIGQMLADERLKIGRAVGAKIHFAPVAREGEEAMKKILLKQGLHLCQKTGDLWLYVGTFEENV
jgi:GNAT superfamily N-acetyltransferase